MSFISPQSGYWFLAIFGVAMVVITYYFARWKTWDTREGFLVASRQVGWFLGGTSIAASWIWAPALFVSVQFAYESGLPGIFWFTFPNILALAVFGFLAPRIRERMPKGYTLPEYIKHRLGDSKVHKMYLVPFFFYQLMAVTIQLFAGGNLLSLLTGIPLTTVMPILIVIALAYVLISGLEASIVTDFVQIAMIVVIGAIILPWTISAAGGFSTIDAGLGGLAGVRNIFDPGIAFSLGIVTAIGLIAGSISDQQYWQRSFAIEKGGLIKAFVFGSLLFGIVPIAMSSLGFLAASPELGIVLPEGVDISMVGVQTVATLLPTWAVFLFVVMLLAGLSSTLDSAMTAASSLWVTDVVNIQDEKKSIKAIRKSIIGIAIAGLVVAYLVYFTPGFGLFHLFWISGAMASTIVVPTVLSLYWDKLDARGVFWGILTAFVVGMPLFIYSNVIENPTWIVGSTLLIVAISAAFCLLFKRDTNWKPATQ